MVFELHSPAFTDGQRIPRDFTCDGDDVSPHLTWSEAPPDTQSFALLCDDPDAPGGTWWHWAAFDIPTDHAGLPQAHPIDPLVNGIRQAVNDFGTSGYRGPCPPPGHGTHRYRFRLLALSVESLGLAERAGCREVEAAAGGHLLEATELVGTYSR